MSRIYTLQRFHYDGSHEVFNGWKQDKVMQWNRTGRLAGGQRLFYTLEDSGDLTYRWEVTPSIGAAWEVTDEGRTTKVK